MPFCAFSGDFVKKRKKDIQNWTEGGQRILVRYGKSNHG